ncbi:MAG: hypothetical protein Kow0031_01170 [Anaerolineae bacterium]
MLTTTNGRHPAPAYVPGASELEQTLQRLRRRFGPTAIGRLGIPAPPGAISTGYPALDAALGGGLPRGRIIDIYGPEVSGKTTLCLNAIAQTQKQGGVCVYIDTEHAFDPRHAVNCGVVLEDLYLAQPETAEQALEIAATLARAGVAVVAIDSAAALLPRAEAETDLGDSHDGLQARLMSQALRKLVGPVRANHTVFIFTNHLRQTAAGRETSTGGLALRHYASVRLELRPQGPVRERNSVTGLRIRARVVKNRVAPPGRHCDFELLFGEV